MSTYKSTRFSVPNHDGNQQIEKGAAGPEEPERDGEDQTVFEELPRRTGLPGPRGDNLLAWTARLRQEEMNSCCSWTCSWTAEVREQNRHRLVFS